MYCQVDEHSYNVSNSQSYRQPTHRYTELTLQQRHVQWIGYARSDVSRRICSLFSEPQWPCCCQKPHLHRLRWPVVSSSAIRGWTVESFAKWTEAGNFQSPRCLRDLSLSFVCRQARKFHESFFTLSLMQPYRRKRLGLGLRVCKGLIEFKGPWTLSNSFTHLMSI